MSRPPAANWTDQELAASVEAYVYLLRLQSSNFPDRRAVVSDMLLESSLTKRNDASVRYRMRNISAIVQELGVPILTAYSPAAQVGRKVRQRLRAMLLSHAGFIQLKATADGSKTNSVAEIPNAKFEALARLAALRIHLDDLERELIGVGHNNPPEPLASGGPARRDFNRAREDITTLEVEVRALQPNSAEIQKRSNRLLDFGLKIVLWMGERATKFTDTTLKLLVPVVVAKATGLMPLLLEALKAVGRVLH